ncbi:MAG: hypothetical protein HY319_14385 [Armatimonadetes bacterium]|nr:hypothetical protein [Armatimonadota bacterium]
MKPPVGKLMAVALRRCRDAEIVWEERVEVDLVDPGKRRERSGWGIRVNLEGRLGWAFGPVDDSPENLLEEASRSARDSTQEGILFSHGLPFTGKVASNEPVQLEPHLEKLSRMVGRIRFLVPSLVPERQVGIRAGLRHQRLTLLTRAGEQTGERIVYYLSIRSPEEPQLNAVLLASRLRESPADILCRLAWRAAHSTKIEELEAGDYAALLTESAAGALLRDLVDEHLNAAKFADHQELAAPWGESWLSPDVTIQDDGTLPSGPGTVAFDGEGQARRPVSLIQDGTVHHHLADRYHARSLGVSAPGLAVRPWGQPPRPGWSNLSMEPGEFSLGDLARKVSDGVILDRLVPCDAPREPGEFCRLAEIAYRLRGGRPAERLTPMLVRGTFTELLGKELMGIGAERSWSGRCFSPPMAVGRLRLEGADGIATRDEHHGSWW